VDHDVWTVGGQLRHSQGDHSVRDLMFRTWFGSVLIFGGGGQQEFWLLEKSGAVMECIGLSSPMEFWPSFQHRAFLFTFKTSEMRTDFGW